MIKAIGQNGLNFIASKYKELKTLISKKADKTEIITQEERKQVDLLKKNYVQESLYAFEKKLKAGAENAYRYQDSTKDVNLFFAYHLIDGSLKIPSDATKPYLYSYQKENINSVHASLYCVLHEDLTPFTLEEIQAMKDTEDAVCYVHKKVVDFFNSCAGSAKAVEITENHFVKKEKGKVLSSNDYTNADKVKIQTIPTVVDNLTTTDATKALSASQGKILQDNKADKSNISRCKTKGYNTSNTWQSLGTERDLEDWIGDFDKRTRELKNNKGLTGDKSEIEQEIIKNSRDPNSGGFVLAKWGRIISVTGFFDTSSGSTSMSADIPVKFSPLDGCEFLCDQGTIGFNVYRDSSGRVNRCEAVVNADSNRHYKTVRWNVVFFSASA